MPRKRSVKAAIYARISSDDERDGLGVRRQLHECQALAERKGWPVLDTYVDNDVSAAGPAKHRPEFNRLLDDVRAGNLEAIVAWDLDRLTRRPRELEELLELCQDAGVGHLATVSDAVDLGTGDGLLVARIKAAVGAEEVEKMRRRIKAKKDELARDGKPAGGGTRPFGYQADRMTLEPEEAELVRSAAKRVLEGETLHGICADWKAAGVRTVTGREWLPNVLRGILVAPRIAGLRQHRGEVAGPAAWPAIIDVETRERLLAVFNAPGRRRTEIEGTRLLTGLLRCGRPGCGGRLLSGMNNGVRVYVCRLAPGKDGCNRLVMVAEPLEDVLVEAVLIRLESADFAAALAGQRAADVDRQDLNLVGELEDGLDELADMLAKREIDRRGYTRARAIIDADLRAARRRVRRQEAHSALDPFLDDPEHARARWDAADPHTAEGMRVRRAVMAAMLEEVEILPAIVRGRHTFDTDRIRPRWRA